MVQIHSSGQSPCLNFEITKPKFWLKKKDCQKLTCGSDSSNTKMGPGFYPKWPRACRAPSGPAPGPTLKVTAAVIVCVCGGEGLPISPEYSQRRGNLVGLHLLFVGLWGIFEGFTLRPRKETGGKDGGQEQRLRA